MKVVMTQAVCPEGMRLLDGLAEVYVADNPDPNNYLSQMQDADALIVRIAKCDANVILNSPKLKVIGRTGVGYDSVDVAEATRRGIPVVITPGSNNRSVAEHAVAMMFSLSKNLYEAQQEMCRGNWEIRGAKKAFELEGKTVGVIGLGAIGRETAKICRGCGMKIAGYDPFLSREQIEALGAQAYENYEDLLRAADIVENGGTAQQAEDDMRATLPRLSTHFIVDTLQYLHMGGRCSSIAFLAGSMLKLHPQINMIDGAMIAGEKFRGKLDRCIAQYEKKTVFDILDQIEPERIFLTHTLPDEPVEALAEEIRREVLAAHVGTEDEVLLETPLSETLFTGYTRLYIPVVVSAPGHKSGEIVHVRLGEYDGERVRAALC